MKYAFKEPSLQQIAELKIATELFNQKDIRTEIAQFNFLSTYPSGEEIVTYGMAFYGLNDKIKENNRKENSMLKNKVIEKVSALPIPKPLKTNVVNLINPLTLAIRKWWFHHQDFKLRTPNKFCWTRPGTVDYKKTAELIVKDENEDIEARYKMACTYCLINEIPILWKMIPETRKELFYCYMDNKKRPSCYRKDLLLFWTYTINDKVTELHNRIRYKFGINISCHLFAFKGAIFGLNRSATEFFFEKLSREEKEANVVNYICRLLSDRYFPGCKLETVFFLLKQMSEEQQEIVFKRHVCDILESMLCWSHQTFILETAKKWLPYSLESCSTLVHLIGVEIQNNENNDDCKELFREVWQLLSANYNDFPRIITICCISLQLYEAEEKELVQYVLNPLTDFQKEQLLNLRVYEKLPIIENQKWDFLKFLMEECITCQEIIINFKRNLARQLATEEDAGSKIKLIDALRLVDSVILNWKKEK